MGLEFEDLSFTEEDEKVFHRRLREETKLLMKQFDSRAFDYCDQAVMGLEIEAWLTDKNSLPLPKNKEFLERANHPLLVPELSQFNFEINVDPQTLSGDCFQKALKQISEVWTHSQKVAQQLGGRCLLTGILPMIREEMLQLEYMSDSNRYRALNERLFKLRKGQPLNIEIEGNEKLKLSQTHLMMEAAATSIQVHLQVNQENGKRYHNASQIVSAPVVALSANSPFLYGKSLWDETRIPVFEQAVNVNSFRNKRNEQVGRVTFGTSYVKRSLFELFIENLDGYPCLIPLLFEENPEKFEHLKFHNGTIWRWTRPIVGNSSGGINHLRLEHRTMASGPSLLDIMANVAFYLGLTEFFATTTKAPEDSMTFTNCTDNFYKAAKNGLRAQVNWFGQSKNIQSLILDDLLEKAKSGLSQLQIDKEEIDFYLGDIIYQRVLNGQNGANWQRSFVDCYGPDFQSLTQRYLEWQEKEIPVHQWKI